MSRAVLYPLRPLESATVRYTAAPHHHRRVTIYHRPLSGITPAMLLDWFTHIGDTMAYGGEIVDRYLAWHPIDHIYWDLACPAPGGGAGEGGRFRIVEAFGGRPEFRVDVVDRVEKLDETGIRLVQRVAGAARSALMSPINRIACRRFPDEMVRAWVRHNIEEVGQLEYRLPQLKSGEAEPAQRA